MNKRYEKIKQRYITSVLVLLTLMVSIFTPISSEASVLSKGDRLDADTGKTNMDKRILSAKESEISNNGGRYVGYKGKVYYWEYNKDSFAADGLFGNYETEPGVKNSMMCLNPDGTKELIFRAAGEGSIYIYNDRMYLQKTDKDYTNVVYSVNFDGTSVQELGKGKIEGIDEKSGTLICTLADKKNTYQLFQVDSAAGKTQQYKLNNPCSQFLALKEGVIYYSGKVKYEPSQYGEIKLCSVKVDGSGETMLVDTKPDMYEYGGQATVIPCIQFVGDTIYFSYGTYGGSGSFWQGGRIAKIKKDGSGFKVLLGIGQADKKAGENDFVYDIFYVTKKKEKEVLYFSKNEIDNFALNIRTGAVKKSSFPIYAEGKPFEYKKGISIYLNASKKMVNWIPFVDYNLLDLKKKGDYYTVKDVEKCGNWIYYKLEANTSKKEASIGWRDGYHREKTAVIREELKGDKKEVLYQY